MSSPPIDWYSSGQVDGDLRWFYLADDDPDYETTREALENMAALYGGTYALDDGFVANRKVVATRAPQSAVNATTPSLTIGAAAVLDQANYSPCINPKAAAQTIRTTIWGDKHPIWGEFLEQPQKLPTDGVDRLVQHWKAGGETVLYIADEDRGDGSGSNYQNAKAAYNIIGAPDTAPVHDGRNYSIIVGCGPLGRLRNQGKNVNAGLGILLRTGTSEDRTVLLAHPVEGCDMFGWRRLAAGNANPATNSFGEDADWTHVGDGLWYCQYGTGAGPSLPALMTAFAMTNQGGTSRPLFASYTLADCATDTDQIFYPFLRGGYHNPTTTYEPGETICYKNFIYYCRVQHSNQLPPDPGPSSSLALNQNTYWAQAPNNALAVWASGTAYTAGAIIRHLNVGYVCILDNTGQTPPNATYWKPLVSIATWNATATYPVGSVALHGGIHYMATAENTNDAPPSGNWTTTPRVYCRLPDGSNPKTTVFASGTTTGGIGPYLQSTTYFDVYGVTFYQQKLSGSSFDYMANFRFIACQHKYGGGGKFIQAQGHAVNLHTGQFVDANNVLLHKRPDLAANRQWLGHVIAWMGDGLYDTGLHCGVPTGTVIRDVYFEEIGGQGFGANIANNDSHSLATLGGFDGATFRNVTCYRCNGQNFVIYVPDTGHHDRDATLTDGAIVDGDFPEMTNWLVTGSVVASGNKAIFTSGSKISQAITIGAGFATASPTSATRRHVIKMKGENADRCQVRIGTTAGATDVPVGQGSGNALGTGVAVTVFFDPTTKYAAVSFVPPSTTFHVEITSSSGALHLSEVSLLSNLASEEGYVVGFPAADAYALLDGRRYAMVPVRDIVLSHFWIKHPFRDTDNTIFTGMESQYVSLNGEATYEGAGKNRIGFAMEHCRIEGRAASSESGVRIKWQIGAPFDETKVSIRRCVFRDVAYPLRTVIGFTDESGNTVDCSFDFQFNNAHAKREGGNARFLRLNSSANPTNHKQVSNNNVFITDDGANFETSGATTYAFAAWPGSATNDDVRDTNSIAQAFDADTGPPTVSIAGSPVVGQTLTAVINDDDPDGSITIHDIQFFAGTELIAGATDTEYVLTSAELGAQIRLLAWVEDAKGKHAQVWSDFTAEVTASGASVHNDIALAWDGTGNVSADIQARWDVTESLNSLNTARKRRSVHAYTLG